MAAITAVLFSLLKAGDTIVAQEAVYSATFTFLKEIAPSLGIQVDWVRDISLAGWEAAFNSSSECKAGLCRDPRQPNHGSG